MRVAAVVLAAGRGSRFATGPGTDTGADGASDAGSDAHKLTVDFRGRPLVTWAVGAAQAAGLDPVLVVTGAVDLSPLLPPGAVEVHNERWAEGQATSLAAGVDAAEALGCDAVVVGLGDQPLVPAEAWRLVAAAADRPIAVATYDGRRRNPVRLARQVWPLLPREGDEGARSLLRRRDDLVAEVACPGESADVDTQEDLARWT